MLKTYNKKTRLNKAKQFLEKLLVDIFVIIGALSILNFACNVTKEAGEFYFSTKTVRISIVEPVKASSPVSSDFIPQDKREVNPSLPVQNMMEIIWTNESSKGKNNYSKCETLGKINGIGYGIWGDNWMCFDSHTEEMKTLEKWITEHKEQGMNDTELLCHYSGGNYDLCFN